MSEYRVGDWYQTSTGTVFWPEDPRPEEVRIEDIAHHLAHICRFGGATKTFYSVAQHSVLVSRIVSPDLAFAGLMHDAAEAYLGDVVRPLKYALPDYRAIETRVEAVIEAAFGLDLTDGERAEIKRADNIALVTERRDLLAVQVPLPWAVQCAPLPDRIEALESFQASVQFRLRFIELGGPARARFPEICA